MQNQLHITKCFSTIQYNTTVKQRGATLKNVASFSTIQYNTTVKRQFYAALAA